MELNLTTFFFEIINFTVLIWVLTRLLYHPILAAIVRRREGVEKILAEADQRRAQAAELQKKYEVRMTQWEQEKAELRRSFDSSLEADRHKQLEALSAELACERERAQAAAVTQLSALREGAQREVAEQGVTFCARLLARLASPTLENSIVEAALADVIGLSAERREALTKAFNGHDTVRVLTRFPLADPARDAVRAAMTTLIGHEIMPAFAQDAALIAGVRIELGSWSLEADLFDELRAFAAVGSS